MGAGWWYDTVARNPKTSAGVKKVFTWSVRKIASPMPPPPQRPGRVRPGKASQRKACDRSASRKKAHCSAVRKACRSTTSKLL